MLGLLRLWFGLIWRSVTVDRRTREIEENRDATSREAEKPSRGFCSEIEWVGNSAQSGAEEVKQSLEPSGLVWLSPVAKAAIRIHHPAAHELGFIAQCDFFHRPSVASSRRGSWRPVAWIPVGDGGCCRCGQSTVRVLVGFVRTEEGLQMKRGELEKGQLAGGESDQAVQEARGRKRGVDLFQECDAVCGKLFGGLIDSLGRQAGMGRSSGQQVPVPAKEVACLAQEARRRWWGAVPIR